MFYSVKLKSILMLFVFLLSVGMLTPAWDRNAAYLQYAKLFQGYETDVNVVIARFLRLQTIQDNAKNTGNEIACYLENLSAYAAYQEGLADLESFASIEDCYHLIMVGETKTDLPLPNLHSNVDLQVRGESELEFRRNGWARMGLVVMSPGLYEISVQARCMGPPPALMDLGIAGDKIRLSYENEPQIHSVEFHFNRGLYWMTIAFVNDLYTGTGDRNFRLIGVWIEHKSGPQ